MIERNMMNRPLKVIIFGIRSSYQLEIEEMLSDIYEIVAYSDLARNSLDSKQINYRPLIEYSQICKELFDYIIIAYRSLEQAECAKKILINECGIDVRKIIEYCKWKKIEYPSILEIWNKSKNIIPYDSLILGMSHAALGIDTNYFSSKVFLAAIGSADIDIMEKHLNAILFSTNSKLRRIIIEIPYYIFNWNIEFSPYYYRMFPLMTTIILREEKKEGHIWNQEMQEYKVFEHMFRDHISKNQYVYNTKCSRREFRNHSKEEIQEMSKELSHVWTKHFEIISRNVRAFETMIRKIRSYDSKMEIQVIVMPQNPIFVEMHKDAINNMKDIFYRNIAPICEQYMIILHDCFEMYSMCSENFCDTCHLNTDGCRQFSQWFAKEILRE